MAAKKKRARKKTGATRKTEKKNSLLSWAIMAIMLAGFVAFLVHLDQLPEQQDNNPAADTGTAHKAAKNSQQETKPKTHEFDFYTVLPDREVDVIEPERQRPTSKPKQVSSKKAPVNKPETPSARSVSNKKPPSNQLYQLQVGAFKELNKADAMKARLALLGVESNIQVIRNNSQPMYRVRVGPSTDNRKMEHIKTQLKAQNINTFMQKL